MTKGFGKPNKKNDIRAVAEAAGVSISTVSRVINESKPVSDELRKRVISAVRKTNYVPDHTARSMVYRRTKTIGIVVPDLSAAFHSVALSSITNRLAASRRRALVCTVRNDSTDEIRYLDLFSKGLADGVILMHETQNARILDTLTRLTIPVVLASMDLNKLDLPGVGIDDAQAAFDATSYLLSLGHRRIGLIAGSELTVGKYRTSGYRKALATAGIRFDRGVVRPGSYSAASGYSAAKHIMEANEDVTAIFAVSDEMAIGALRCLKDLGLRVPGQVSVMGFDDIDIAGYYDPPLTTVRQPIREIGEQAASVLLDIIEDKHAETNRIVLPHEVIVRSSTAPPRNRRT